jgi:hypothetical protein
MMSFPHPLHRMRTCGTPASGSHRDHSLPDLPTVMRAAPLGVGLRLPLAPATTSPTHPESAKTASLPRDAPFPMRRSPVVSDV